MNPHQNEGRFRLVDPNQGGYGRTLDQDSIKYLVRRFRAWGLSYADAEEAANDTAVEVWKKSHEYSESIGELENWVMKFAKNVLLRYYRKRAEALRREVSIEVEPEASNLSIEPEIVSELSESAHELLNKYGSRLKEAEKTVLNERYLGESERAVKEASTSLGWDESNVTTITNRAMKSIRASILAQGKEDGCLEGLALKEKAVLQMNAHPKPFTDEPLATQIQSEVESLKAMVRDERNKIYLRTLKIVYRCLSSNRI